jgi:hypothetical protein
MQTSQKDLLINLINELVTALPSGKTTGLREQSEAAIQMLQTEKNYHSVIRVCADDIVGLGFIPQHPISTAAGKLGDNIVENYFWDALAAQCYNLGWSSWKGALRHYVQRLAILESKFENGDAPLTSEQARIQSFYFSLLPYLEEHSVDCLKLLLVTGAGTFEKIKMTQTYLDKGDADGFLLFLNHFDNLK